jgi:hypothetical protein
VREKNKRRNQKVEEEGSRNLDPQSIRKEVEI